MVTLSRHMPSTAKAANHSITNALLAAVGPAILNRLSSGLETVTVEIGDVLYVAGAANEFVYFPEDAVVSHVYFGESGASVEAAMVGREGASGLCGILSRGKAKHTAVVIFSGNAHRISVDDLTAATLADQQLQTVLYEYMTFQSAEMGQRVACEAFHMADERLCSWLLMLQDRAQSDRMMITHEEIATFLGINRASISSIAKRLKDSGLINYVRGKLSITNRPGLEGLACECYPSRKQESSTRRGRSQKRAKAAELQILQ